MGPVSPPYFKEGARSFSIDLYVAIIIMNLIMINPYEMIISFLLFA
jgi:hypothetical protein